MKSIQEQEHFDHVAGSASESQNALTEARQAASYWQQFYAGAIAAVVAAGRFAVVDRQPYYCRATDAVAGSVEYLRGDFATRGEASVAAYALNFSEGENSDGEFYVLPRLPQPVAVSAPDSDIPF